METRSKFYIIVISVLAILVIILGILNFSQVQTSAEIKNLEQCNILEFNGEEKLNLVFFGTEKESRDYTDYFLESSPFDKYKESFNFYFIDDFKPSCEFYKGKAILCNSRELMRKAASCPHDYIIVLKDEPKQIRSSSYKNVMSINTQHPKSVLLHEFGHGFANLAEEYTPAKIPRGSKNCVSDCSKFNGKINDCSQECSKSNYYRSVSEGVMRTLTTDNFGIFNENLIIELIKKAVPQTKNSITGNVINTYTDCSKQEYAIVDISPGNAKALEKGLGCSPKNSGAGEFSYDLNGEKNTFSPTIFTEFQQEDSPVITGDSEERDSFSLLVPFESNEQQIKIFDSEGNLYAKTGFGETGRTLCLKE